MERGKEWCAGMGLLGVGIGRHLSVTFWLMGL